LSWLCAGCDAQLRQNRASRQACPRCALDRNASACTCKYAWDYPFEKIVAFFTFDGTVQKLVHQFKYQGKSALARHLGRSYSPLHDREDLGRIDLIVPVPLHFLRRMQRGYNQAECLGRGVAQAGGPALASDVLRRTRHTKTQTRLNSTQRHANLAGAFSLNPARADIVRDKHIVLVDDVITTGATVSACSRILLSAGARAVTVLALARA
jgi:ComF family protein